MRGEDHKNEEGLPAWARQCHASLFTEDATIQVPAGWRKYVLNCLDALQDMNMGICIACLVAREVERNDLDG